MWPWLGGQLQLDDTVLAKFHDCRKRQTTPILAYLVVQALCMLIMAILIILLLIGMVVAIPTAADEIAADDDGDGNKWSKTA